MATSTTDKLFEAMPRMAGKVGAGGVTSISSTTVPHTFVGLTEGDCYIVTANRTNSTGTVKNSLSNTETFIGKVSSGNFIDCVREVEGSAQAWAADTVLEILFTSAGWNKLLEHLLNEHNQDGTHKSSKVLPTSYLDTDTSLTANSDTKIASQKAVKTYVDGKAPSSGWNADTNTWTYASADAPTFTLTVDADVTGYIGVGDRIKLTQTTDKYFIVTAISYGAPNTTITLYGGTDYTLANAAITSPYYSHLKSPIGFPVNPTKWAVEAGDTTQRVSVEPGTGVWVNVNSAESIVAPIGVWKAHYEVFSYDDGSTNNLCLTTLSTANNSESNPDSTVIFGDYAGKIIAMYQKDFVISVASKTTLYLNTKGVHTAPVYIYHNNNTVPLKIRLTCAYL